jgi:hypothetical protein
MLVAMPPSDSPPTPEEHLRAIRALTDATLGQLHIEEFLNELLDRVRAILHADTAAVLLLDEGGTELEARAARGIEEEVRQGVRVPLGRGFAGRIAAEKRPVVLDRVDPTTVSNPLLYGKGIRAMLGVPLLSGARVLGVLHVGTLGDRTFTDEDVELLQLVADRVAGAIQTRLSAVDLAVAGVMQRSLLPSGLPSIPGLEFAARYLPTSHIGVGGDWYDVFVLPTGDVWVVVGDVAGHGVHAATVMGRLRGTIRAYALVGHSPGEVLTRADACLQQFEPAEMATVLCAALSPPFDHLELANAGHLPPLLATPGEPAAFVDIDRLPPLGVVPNLDRPSRIVPIDVGALLFLYTDGLVERRDQPLDVRLERLRAAVVAQEPTAACHTVMAHLVGEREAEDDVAALAVRRVTEQP